MDEDYLVTIDPGFFDSMITKNKICAVIVSLSLTYTVQTLFLRVAVRDYIEERAIAIANYIIEHGTTVRQTAKDFGVSKSTVHKDVTERLENMKPSLAKEVRRVLDVNKSERHIRGGMATKEKYLHQR